uniref:Protein kinase domain-containing protein n=1 Tax=Chromera velia CCMP2878 TaxID=1169474 RepID=A0A0G4G4C4_9ALVE|eukprot:Cvel_20196.t1-p1 / transcript=Cvel_20196.t1 / gene=Cvel_20196 / organism=Chromera_velia_CCMP2878 / gene_product=Serine/threonine-protein kinase EDR1, putative / transcript_product=Serine/threonine-protein kinase EDR1, putative / location=Cvel_scaffold1796:23736-27318(-) / protein_length=626 / sequence_SO=supercontig / SO=protein_coding / is_pseudo=false
MKGPASKRHTRGTTGQACPSPIDLSVLPEDTLLRIPLGIAFPRSYLAFRINQFEVKIGESAFDKLYSKVAQLCHVEPSTVSEIRVKSKHVDQLGLLILNDEDVLSLEVMDVLYVKLDDDRLDLQYLIRHTQPPMVELHKAPCIDFRDIALVPSCLGRCHAFQTLRGILGKTNTGTPVDVAVRLSPDAVIRLAGGLDIQIEIQPALREMQHRSLVILTRANHPNIVSLVGVCKGKKRKTEGGGKQGAIADGQGQTEKEQQNGEEAMSDEDEEEPIEAVVTEFMPGGDLRKWIYNPSRGCGRGMGLGAGPRYCIPFFDLESSSGSASTCIPSGGGGTGLSVPNGNGNVKANDSNSSLMAAASETTITGGGEESVKSRDGDCSRATSTESIVLNSLRLVYSVEEMRQMMRIARDIAEGMRYLHDELKAVHANLKPSSVLLDGNGRAVLADFTSSRIYQSDALPREKASLGSEWRTKEREALQAVIVSDCRYAAPEVLSGWSFSFENGRQADVYSFGVLLWEMLLKETPWEGMSEEDVVHFVGYRGERLQMKDLDAAFFSTGPVSSSPKPKKRESAAEGPQGGQSTSSSPLTTSRGFRMAFMGSLLRDCMAHPADRPSFSEIVQAFDSVL